MFVTKVSVSRLFSFKNIRALITEYAKCANHYLNENLGNFEFYQEYYQKEDLSDIVYFALIEGEEVKGFFSYKEIMSGHLGGKIAYMDSEFVTRKYRHNGGSRLLLNTVYSYLKDTGVQGLVLSAQAGSRLEKIYNRKYKKTDSLYFKEI